MCLITMNTGYYRLQMSNVEMNGGLYETKCHLCREKEE